MLNLPAISGATVAREPFDYFIADGVVSTDAAAAMSVDFPSITGTGSFPISQLQYGAVFQALVEELRSAAFARVIGDLLGCNLENLPQLITARGRSGPRDGFVHTDSTWKIVTALLYLNTDWSDDGGRLRLLRSTDIEDVAAEVPPRWGTLVAFRRSDNSFHGHLPFHGERRLVQVNWVPDAIYVRREERRHRRSAALKAVVRTLYAGRTRTPPDAYRDR